MRKTTAKSPKNIITFINCNKQFFLDRRRPARTGADRRRPAQTGADRRKPAQTGADRLFSVPPETITDDAFMMTKSERTLFVNI